MAAVPLKVPAEAAAQLQAAAEKALADLPRVQHQDQVQVGSELGRLLQVT
jgi:ATP-dependent Clp protease ATP-binding subunit ClpB